jgi:hypothetical protein
MRSTYYAIVSGIGVVLAVIGGVYLYKNRETLTPPITAKVDRARIAARSAWKNTRDAVRRKSSDFAHTEIDPST